MWSDLFQAQTDEKTQSTLSKNTQTCLGFHIFNYSSVEFNIIHPICSHITCKTRTLLQSQHSLKLKGA